MTTLRQVHHVIKSNNIPKEGYRTHKEHLNNQVKDLLNKKWNNKVCWEFVMIVIIKKKQVKEFVGSIRKIVIRFILLTSFVF